MIRRLILAASLSVDLGGNAARQVLIIVAATWGWTRWRRNRQEEGTVMVRWGSGRERIGLVVAMALIGLV